MASQTIIITGATQGLGYHAAQTLAQQKYVVVMAGRDPARNEAAANAIRQATGNATVYAMTLDLAALASVRQFVRDFSGRTDLPPLVGLVNNAGLQIVGPTEYTPDGIEMTFGVNHLGHFLLTSLLLPHFAQNSRIVMVSSGTHYDNEPFARALGVPPPAYTSAEALARPGLAHPGPTTEKPQQAGAERYSTSKLCNLLFAYELDRRLQAQGRTGLTVNAYDPGLMPGSGLARQAPAPAQWAWRHILPVLRLFPGVGSVQTSGPLLAALITDPAFAGQTGKYLYFYRPGDMREKPSSPASYDLVKARDLWDTSERLSGLAVRVRPASI
ncbi:MAG: SDR family NAD(P)-dependent oxidoreductase [Bacteroidetes bacterium]|nr:SDR family NAD(P)-dependent oxidoreductase [Fibrella sp.]